MYRYKYLCSYTLSAQANQARFSLEICVYANTAKEAEEKMGRVLADANPKPYNLQTALDSIEELATVEVKELPEGGAKSA